MPKKSTITNLLTLKEYVLQAFNRENTVHVLYTDIAKAFDFVNHKLLIKKLNEYGITGSLLKWFESYLDKRTQYVKINDIESKEIKYISGVPQGSKLGPLLYIIYVNDLKNCIHNSKFLLYIDDLKLFKEIENNADKCLFIEDIERIHNWNTNNGLSLNLNKCKIMIYNKKKNKNVYESGENKYKINNTEIDSVSVMKDLGVFCDEALTFDSHIDFIISKAKKRIYFLKKILNNFSNIDSLKLFYNTHIKSVLMYASIIWSPHQLGMIKQLERVQNQILRIMALNQEVEFDYFSHDYEELMKKFDIKTIESSRNISKLKFLHKLLNNKIDSIELLQIVNFNIQNLKLRNMNILFSIPYDFKTK